MRAAQVLGLRPVGGPRRSARGRAAAWAAEAAPASPPGRASTPWRSSRGRSGASAARAGTSAARPRSSSIENTISRRAVRRSGRCRAGRRRGGSPRRGRGRSAPPGRGWRRSWPCGRRGARTAAPPAGAPPGSTRTARSASGRCPRSARASGAARRSSRARARTARARARSRARRRSSSDSIVRDTSSGSDTEPPRRNGQALARRPPRSRSPRPRTSRRGLPPAALTRRPTLADQLARVRRRDHHHAVPAAAELVGQPLDVAVDLVVHAPRGTA